LTFAVAKLGLRPQDFWQLTFAEFWPMYNAVVGKIEMPMTANEVRDLENRWINGNS